MLDSFGTKFIYFCISRNKDININTNNTSGFKTQHDNYHSTEKNQLSIDVYLRLKYTISVINMCDRIYDIKAVSCF